MEIEGLSHVPPAIPLLLSEVDAGPAASWTDLRARFKRLLPELRNQSEWYLSQKIDAATQGGLEIHLDGGLNIFDQEMCCPTLDCRIEAAKRLCRSVGLLGDTIWLTDHLSPEFAQMGRLTDKKVEELANHAIVLKQLEPFIQAGIVRFKPAPYSICLKCGEELNRQVEKIADHLVQVFAPQFDVEEVEAGLVMLTTGDLCDPPMGYIPSNHFDPDPDVVFSTAAWNFVKETVQRVLWVAHQASPTGGSVFSDSKVGLAALAFKEGLARDAQEVRALETSRNMTLPWVSQLEPAQVIQLRQEADKALPVFREALAKALEASPAKPEAVRDAIATLREQAAEVRGELEGAQKHGGRFWKTSFMTMGFGACAYGASTGNIPMALTGLLPLMNLMITHQAGTEKDIDKLKRRPGYVFVKAQDILAHAH